MTVTPIVSILMPVKNTALYLKECLDSICTQNLTNWELIALDDHSTDQSLAILMEYEAKESRIRVFRNKGQGIIPALQWAYAHARGKYITRMDSDDLMLPEKLEMMLGKLREKGSGHLAVGLVNYFSAGKLGEGYVNYANWLNTLTLSAANFDDIYKECPIPSPCWMIARTDFETCGGFNSEVYPEDYDLAFRFRQAGLKIAPVKEVIHLWRDYDLRTSRTDANYADNRFTELKIMHFLTQDYKVDTPLVVWGAGKKGKKIAKLLTEKGVIFYWLCNNDKKIGKDIYGTLLQDLSNINNLPNAQIIIAVSSPTASVQIAEIIRENPSQQYFQFF